MKVVKRHATATAPPRSRRIWMSIGTLLQHAQRRPHAAWAAASQRTDGPLVASVRELGAPPSCADLDLPDRSAVADDPQALLLAAGSLPAAWVRRWEADPARPLLHDAGRWITAAELEERSRRVAGRLAAAGLEPGDRLLTSAESSAELVVAHVAALRLGLVVVPVNGAYREREIAHIVRDARPSAALVDNRERGEWIIAGGRPGGACSWSGPRSSSPTASPRRSTRARPTTARCSATRRARPALPRARCSPTPTCSRAPPRSSWRGGGTPTIGSCSRSRCSTCTGSVSVCTARCCAARRRCCSRSSILTRCSTPRVPSTPRSSSACRRCTTAWHARRACRS